MDDCAGVLAQGVVCRPVAEASVCVFASSGKTYSRMASSMKSSDRADAVSSA
jgi:hypothetical protein